jgi:hypothetical protein
LAAAALVAAGALTWPACSTLLLLCCSLAAADGEPGSQLTSLLLQLGVAACLMPLGTCFSLDATLGRSLRAMRLRPWGTHNSPSMDGAESVQAVPLWSVLLLRCLLTKPYVQVRGGAPAQRLAVAICAAGVQMLTQRTQTPRTAWQDAVAKITDAGTFLFRAQPVAARLAAVTGRVPGAAPLPWAVAWTSCLLDVAVSSVVLARLGMHTSILVGAIGALAQQPQFVQPKRFKHELVQEPPLQATNTLLKL